MGCTNLAPRTGSPTGVVANEPKAMALYQEACDGYMRDA